MKQKRAFALFAALIAALLVLSLPKTRLFIIREIRSRSTQNAAAKIYESRSGYSVIKANNTRIYFTRKDREYAALTNRLIKTYLPLISADFGLDYTPDITLIIYPSKEKMYSAIGYRSTESKEEKTPMGAYSAGIIAVLSPSCWAEGGKAGIDEYITSGPVVHELVHLVLDMKTKGNYPHWFSEGAAQYYEQKYVGGSFGTGSAQAVSYRALTDSFKYINEHESYRKSYEIIRFISEKSGESGLRRIYGRLEKGEGLDKVLRTELGESYGELDEL